MADAWNSIMADKRLARARELLSIDEIKMIIDYAKADERREFAEALRDWASDMNVGAHNFAVAVLNGESKYHPKDGRAALLAAMANS